jgi:glycosyltransferase involved in cell wall biosynthesis
MSSFRPADTVPDRPFVVIGGLALSLTNFRQPLLEALIGRKFRVVGMAGEPNVQTTEKLRALGIDFVAVSLDRTSLNPLQATRSVVGLVKSIASLKPTAVLAYTVKPVIFGLLAARIAGVKNRYALITGLGFGFSGEGWKRKLLTRSLTAAYKVALLNANVVFFQNPDDEALFREKVLPSSVPSHVVRGSGLDTSHFVLTPLPGTSPIKFLFVGRFLVEKGLRELIEATRMLKKKNGSAFELHTVGWIDPNPSGITEAELSGWIADGLIVHHGRVDDVRPHLAACHALVLPSYREGTPRSVLEAMALGRAVITTDVPGCREPVVNDETGFVVAVKDPHALAEAMQRLFDQPELMQQFGDAGRKRVVELYEAKDVAAGMVATIEKSLRNT